MLHSLLHGDIVQAFRYNALLMCALPYWLLCLVIMNTKSLKSKKWLTQLYGPVALGILTVIVITFWIMRNIYVDIL